MPVKELRSFAVKELRVKREEGKAPKIEGYAALYNSRSEEMPDGDGGTFREIIAPGAFTKTLAAKPDIRALINHDPNMVLGRTTAGTMRLEEDKKGLRMSIDPPDTACARDLMTSMERGDINQCSFGFFVPEGGDDWDEDDGDGLMVRTLREVDMHNGDCSVVTFPAYASAKAAVRSVQEWRTRRIMAGKTAKRAAKGAKETRGWVASGDADDACRDACRQACDAAESFGSVSWDLEGRQELTDARIACADVYVVAQACASVITNEESRIASFLATLCAKACFDAEEALAKIEHPTAEMAAAIFTQCAKQCTEMATETKGEATETPAEEAAEDAERSKVAAANAAELDRLRLKQ